MLEDDSLVYAAKEWLRRVGPDFYRAGLQALVPRLRKAVERDGDYVEKTIDRNQRRKTAEKKIGRATGEAHSVKALACRPEAVLGRGSRKERLPKSNGGVAVCFDVSRAVYVSTAFSAAAAMFTPCSAQKHKQ
ncbi:hypothetical protein ANN_04223 [Periplaneta americana]|uniref:Uncharacterized protein n=1 Tax=Periplaneta americana TaxID=6978 RepID=A0ABQ8T7Z4_PERAM|nr:hypothetical protein ANN_04223 [Periplaneta americana]